MFYKEKYLKYKNKYLNLKNQLGGGKGDNEDKGGRERGSRKHEADEDDIKLSKSTGAVARKEVLDGQRLLTDDTVIQLRGKQSIGIPKINIDLIQNYMTLNFDKLNNLVDQNNEINNFIYNNDGITPLMAIIVNKIMSYIP